MLTKETIRAWKRANTIVCFIANGQAKLRLIHKVKDKHYEETEQHLDINGFKGIVREGYRSAIFCDIFASSGNWAALALIVKPGDELRFRAIDNQNGYLKAAEIRPERLNPEYHLFYDGIHHDTLYVDVIRYGKNNTPKVILRDFHLDDVICPDNTARALRV